MLFPGLTTGRRNALAPPRQVIDDTKHVTLVGLGSVSADVKKALESDKRSATKNKASVPRRQRATAPRDAPRGFVAARAYARAGARTPRGAAG